MCVVLAAAKNFAYDKFLLSYNYSHGEFETIIELPMGEHEFKYLVDGKWVHDPNLVRTNYALLMHQSMYSKTPPKLKMHRLVAICPFYACFSLSTSCNKLCQTHHFATSLKPCYNLLKQLAASLWINK